jgi:hypothetical protein
VPSDYPFIIRVRERVDRVCSQKKKKKKKKKKYIHHQTRGWEEHTT